MRMELPTVNLWMETNETDKTDQTNKTGKTDKTNKIDKINKTKKIYMAFTGDVKRYRGCKRLVAILCAVLMMACMLAGCGMVTVSEEKIRDLDYTVLSEKELPEELLALISQKKLESFKMTFEDKGFLYICQGYGEQPTAGYSICVDDAYVTSNAIYFATSLIGPEAGEPKTTQPTYPYIVIKTEMQDGTVVFGD